MTARYRAQHWGEVGPVVIDTRTGQTVKDADGRTRVYPSDTAAADEVARREGVRAADRAGAGARKVQRGRRS